MKVLFAPGSDRPGRILDPLHAAGIEVSSVIFREDQFAAKMSLMCRSFVASLDEADVVLTDVCTAAHLSPMLLEFLGDRPIVLRPRADPWQEDVNRLRHSRMPWLRSFVSPRLLQFFYHRADAIVPVSAFLGECIAAHTGLDASAFPVINEPVDTERFSPVSRAESLQMRKDLGLDYQHLICIIGSFVYDDKVMGIDHFMPVLHALIERHPGVAVAIAGGGPRHAPFLERNREWLKHPRMIVQGHVDRVEHLYQASDLCAHFSFFDSLALVLFEAWSCGLPVVANDYPAFTENILPGETGEILSDDVTIEEALPVLERLLFDDEYRRALGENGREYVRQNWTSEMIGRQFREVLESVMR